MRSRRKCQKFRNRQNLSRLRTFPQFAVSRCPRSTISQRSVTSTLVANKMWTLQAYLASSSYTGTVVGPSWHKELCAMMLSMPDSRRGLRSISVISWASPWVMHGSYPTDKSLTRLFCSCFYSRFTPSLATTRLDVLLLVHMKDSAFTSYLPNSETLPSGQADFNQQI